MKKKLDWWDWFYGLLQTSISGGSGAVIASLTAMGITPLEYNLSGKLGATMKMFATCFVLNWVINTFLWLQKKPLPDEVTVDKTTSTTQEPGKMTVTEKTTTKTVQSNGEHPPESIT